MNDKGKLWPMSISTGIISRAVLTVLCCCVGLLLVGCGGGGGTSGSTASSQAILLQTTSLGTLANASWVAFQDGNNSWQPLASSTTGNYAGRVTNAPQRYAYAVVNAGATRTEVQIYCATYKELPNLGSPDMTVGNSSASTVSGTISGVMSGETDAEVNIGSVGQGFSQLSGAGDSRTYSLQLSPGTYDVAAITHSGGALPSRVYLERGLAVEGNVTHDITLGSTPETFTLPETYSVNYTGFDPAGTPSTSSWAYTGFRSQQGTWMTLGSGASPAASGAFSYGALPESVLLSGDVYQVNLGESAGSATRTTQLYFAEAGYKSVNLQPWLSGATATLGGGGAYLRPEASWTPYPKAIFYSLTYSTQPAGSVPITWDIFISRDWLSGNSTYTLPDFSALAGWHSAWGMPANAVITSANISTTACNRPLLQYLHLFNTNLSLWADTEVDYASDALTNLSQSRAKPPRCARSPRYPLFPLKP